MKNIYGYTEILEDLIRLKGKYEDKLWVNTMGSSCQGRFIPCMRIGRGKEKLLAVASVHGREHITSAFLMRCVKDLLECEEIPSEKSLFVVPVLNPDGVEISLNREEPFEKQEEFKPELFKNNANNVNLNANFPYLFSKVPKHRQGGKAPASEPETKALVRLCEKEGFASAIALHARGNCVFWRDLGNGVIEGDMKLAKSLAQTCGFELISPTRSPADYSGGFENWFRCKFRRPALCVELVKDEEMSFSGMYPNFEKTVLWDKTKAFLKTYIKFS